MTKLQYSAQIPTVDQVITKASSFAQDGSQPLDNPNHERFAQLISKGGISVSEAYKQALDSTQVSAYANSFRLMEDDGISTRIKYLQEALARKTVLTMQKAMEFCSTAVLTPIGDIDEHSPFAQALKRDPETGKVTEIKMVDKLKALEIVGRTMRWLESDTAGVNVLNQINVTVDGE